MKQINSEKGVSGSGLEVLACEDLKGLCEQNLTEDGKQIPIPFNRVLNIEFKM